GAVGGRVRGGGCGAGRGRLEAGQQRPGLDGVALLDEDLDDAAPVLGADRVLHLHGLEHHHGRAGGEDVARGGGAVDHGAEHRAGQVVGRHVAAFRVGRRPVLADAPPYAASPWRRDPVDQRVARVIFEADTPTGKLFDVVLLVLIAASVLLVMFESVTEVREAYGTWLLGLELAITGLFTGEYLARLWASDDTRRYARSFYGVIDLLAILPVYLSLLIPGAQSLLMVRALRLLRIFRVFKMARWLGEANFLVSAMRSSLRKIAVFLLTVLLINLIVGS